MAAILYSLRMPNGNLNYEYYNCGMCREFPREIFEYYTKRINKTREIKISEA